MLSPEQRESLQRIVKYAEAELIKARFNAKGGKRRLTQTEFFDHALTFKALADVRQWMEGV